jgi:ankyrin repeat protein
MGFDWAHTISSISKLILRSARNADNGGSGDNDSKDSQFESICSEFNQNKLMKKYQGYAQNEKFKVGLNGKTVYIFDNDENELARFQDAPYMYRGKFIPNTNTLVVKSTAGWLLFYDLDNLVLIKKIRFSNIGSQTKNFAITQDGKYLYNIEAPNYSIRTQLTKYDLRTLKPVITSFHNSETIFLEYVEISNEAIFLFGFMRNDKGIKDYGFISQYKEIGEKCILRDGKRIADVVYEKISQYKGCEDFGFTKKSLEYSGLEKIEDLEPYTLSGVYQDIIESNKARGRINNEKTNEESSFYNWLENALKKLPSDVEAINFNLYEDNGDKWSVELVGTSTFDENNSDWACSEIYTTRETPYVLRKKSDWKAIENLFTTFLLNYLERGKYAHILKECRGIGIGFVDGDLSILYKKDKRKEAEEAIESVLSKYKDRAGFLSMLDEYGRDIYTHMISNEAEETALKALYAVDDVNKEDRYGYSYLTFACVGHKAKVIEELLRMGADPNHKSHPLLKALGRKNKDNPAILELFIQYGVDLKADVNGSTVEETIRSFGDKALNQILDKNKPPKGMNGMYMYFSARTQTLAQFKEVYDKRLLNETPQDGSPVIFCAMANQTPQNRYDIVKFLIGEGAELKGTNEESETLFHILFSRPKHIMEQTVELTQILIDAGVDINQLDAKHRAAIQYLISHPKFTDEDFAPLYDVIFQNCTLEVNAKNDWGYTPIELARKLQYRADLLKRMTE